jgi:putative ABC transport system permease protein
MKIFNLAMANLKKGKGAASSLFVLILIAALLLNVGMTVISQINTFYDNKVEELHGAHVNIIMHHADYKQPYEDFLKTYAGVKETEKEKVILLDAAKFRYADGDLTSSVALINANTNRSVSPLKLIEKIEPTDNNDIFMPYSFKVSGGYTLGDNFMISYQGVAHNYRIAGFFEETMLGTTNMGIMKFILPDAPYHQLSVESGEKAEGILLSAILTDHLQSPQLVNDYTKKFLYSDEGESSQFFWGADIEMVKSVSTMTVNIVAMILVAFAAVIVIVSLIVIKFRVTNSIDDGMVNIGVLKAVGYTSRQILVSITMQFTLIALSAGVVGAAISYAVMPVFGGIITSLSGLLWTQSFNANINMASIVIVVLLVLTVTLLSSTRIRKIAPVAALRGGIMTHSFKKNFFPLEKARGGLHFVLACKTMITNSKQNFMIALIMVAITFASVFSVVLYYNIATDKTAFIHLVGAENTSVVVQTNDGIDKTQLLSNIEQMDGVEKISLLDSITASIDDQIFATYISDDYNKMNNNTVYEGRNPQYDNEIAVSGMVAKLLHKKIGDTVKVKVNDGSHSFLITGLSQSINNMGKFTSMTLSGVQHLIPDYNGTMINVYLKDVDNSNFIQDIKAQYGGMIKEVIDMDEMLESQTPIYISAVFAVMVMILAITILVVILILYLVIKTMILKRKREFGILKAIGYTTLQLMNQIALSFVPIVVVGVLIGGVLGCLYTNSVLTLLLSGAGIYNVQFIVNIPLILVLCTGIIVLAYLVSMLVARRIKRISAYGLITE